ncbi:hypothetical protein VNO77_42721 [Canavalia gladiata]|uniref:Uncharacterized protein n=1 Tax=Canavalia gladiata TaxID=3824 RepID=A0AAN9JSS8_CANGL
MSHRSSMLCVSLITLLLLSQWQPTLADEGALNTQTNEETATPQLALIEKKLWADHSLFHHHRKLGDKEKKDKKKKKKKKKKEKSSANHSGISMSHVLSTLCTSILLLSFLLIR